MCYLLRLTICSPFVITSSRYAFRTPEKVALQEIGPRFTLKLRSMKKGLPAVRNLAEMPQPLEFDVFDEDESKDENIAPADGSGDNASDADADSAENMQKAEENMAPPKSAEFQWIWKVCTMRLLPCFIPDPSLPIQPELETTRRTFFL